tara:strand:+ start:317 stop:514 length:198 start_codon:yes stop_codon:yes gene_type:complete
MILSFVFNNSDKESELVLPESKGIKNYSYKETSYSSERNGKKYNKTEIKKVVDGKEANYYSETTS